MFRLVADVHSLALIIFGTSTKKAKQMPISRHRKFAVWE
jgi:hypothetical protein